MTKRQCEIFKLLEEVNWTADVGCDHGVLTLEMLKSNISANVLATDISAPSLQKTIDLIDAHDLLDRTAFACCDGLPVDAILDQILIAGMGGLEICKILSAYFSANTSRPVLVLQPMRDEEKVRDTLNKFGYCITVDKIVFDKKFYRLIKATAGEQTLTLEQRLFGAIKESYFDPDFLAWLDEKMAKNIEILSQISENDPKFNLISQFLLYGKNLKG